jgi:hypothetical protein
MRKINYERGFVEQFLRVLLSEQKDKKIPFDNDMFAAGITSASDYYKLSNFNNYSDKLNLLFQKQTTEGEYDRFIRIIEEMNGVLVELHNPHHVSFSITMENDYVEYLKKNNETNIPENELQGIVRAFEKGAQIAHA